MKKIGIMGAGSWGTALAILLSNNGHDVTVWSIDKNEVEMLSEKRTYIQTSGSCDSGSYRVYQ